MNKVTTIHLAGRAYQLEESGYDVLRRYLDDAAAALAENPDRDEIIGDLETALAERCQAYLGAHKDVVTTQEISQMLAEMGPVKNDTSEATHEEAASQQSKDSGAPRKLYQIRQGAWISGVCTGLAAYLNVDVTLVRVIFVLLTVLSHGAMALVYFVMMMIVPHADTPKERAQAWGVPPLKAQDFIDRARTGYETFKQSNEWEKWRHQMKQESHAWKHKMRHERRHQQKYANQQWHYSPFWEFMHMVLGLVWLLVISFFLWYAYTHVPPVHQFFDLLGVWATHAGAWVKQEWISLAH